MVKSINNNCQQRSTSSSSSLISEEDRSFFMVLDIVFSLHQHSSAELGYYYEAECEDTFSMKRFEIASKYFHYYDQYRPLKCLQRFFVKYVNISSKYNYKKSSCSLSKNVQQRIRNQLINEFNLIKKYNHYGLVPMYLICCRIPNIFYIFMDHPDETLDEYLQRHKVNMLPNYSAESKSFQPIKLIAYEQTKFILKSISMTLLRLHENLIFHGRLTANAIFLNNTKHHNSNNNNNNNKLIVRLANLSFAKIFNNQQQQQQQQIEIQRTKERINLYEIAIRLANCTQFESINERDKFYNIIALLLFKDRNNNHDYSSPSTTASMVTNNKSSNSNIDDNQSMLQAFAHSL